jgi:putative glutamine amidotransferase
MVELFAAVTAPVRETDEGMQQSVLEAGYLRGMRVSGLLPLVLSPLDDEETRRRMFDVSSALVLTGGEDVHPGRYQEELNGARRVSPERDEMEHDLLIEALERRLPILAICRGMQMLNVALGGTLHQDLAQDFDDTIDHDSWRDFGGVVHTVNIEGEDLLRPVFDSLRTEQNSAHHQGVKTLAGDLTPVAWAPDGLIEAVEYRRPGAAWTAGVQWHPERRIDSDCGVNRRLFERFGDAVRGLETNGPRLLK